MGPDGLMSEVVDGSDWLVSWLKGVGWGGQERILDRRRRSSEYG